MIQKQKGVIKNTTATIKGYNSYFRCAIAIFIYNIKTVLLHYQHSDPIMAGYNYGLALRPKIIVSIQSA